MGVSADDCRPLQKDLIAVLGFGRAAKIVVQVIVFKAQSVKFAEIPGEVWRVAHGPLRRGINDRSVVDLESVDQFLLSFRSA